MNQALVPLFNDFQENFVMLATHWFFVSTLKQVFIINVLDYQLFDCVKRYVKPLHNAYVDKIIPLLLHKYMTVLSLFFSHVYFHGQQPIIFQMPKL